MIQVAILGFGKIGKGTASFLKVNKTPLLNRTGETFSVKRILDIRDIDDPEYSPILTKDIGDILADNEISVVIETMGGSHPAYEYTVAALKAGKNVVTSNKEVVSHYGPEFQELAKQNHVRYLYEASVGGGIPVLRTLQNDLSGNSMISVSGILNGTTNYILTKMADDNLPLRIALKEAQQKGYAEADPTADVEGIDAGRKISILCAIAFGSLYSPELIHTEGITSITGADIRDAKAFGGCIKLIAHAEKTQDGKICAYVMPHVIPSGSPFLMVNDVFNAVRIRGNMIGDILLYGQGAGAEATSSAVVSDLIDIAVNSAQQPTAWKSNSSDALNGPDSIPCRRLIGFREPVLHRLDSLDGLITAGDYAYVSPCLSDSGFVRLVDMIRELGLEPRVNFRILD